VADTFDLGRLRLSAGEGRRLPLTVRPGDFKFGGQDYEVEPVEATLDAARTTGGGYSLRLRFETAVDGPCTRCLEDAGFPVQVDAREIDQPGAGDEELVSPYVDQDELNLRAWARDALALELPPQILCTPDCKGICPDCGKNLNTEPHEHEKEPDPRWAKLNELKL
jgi:uncharacterized protein